MSLTNPFSNFTDVCCCSRTRASLSTQVISYTLSQTPDGWRKGNSTKKHKKKEKVEESLTAISKCPGYTPRHTPRFQAGK